MRGSTERILIEKVAEGCGVKYVKVVDPFRIDEAAAVLKEALQQSGPSVVVFRAPCVLVASKTRRRMNAKITPFRIAADKCTDCMACVRSLGCPALVVEDGKVRIDEVLCAACGLCASVCPYNAIEGRCGE
jgi:indolepyruvate ferredoxin oxidoreductase alpha subunit